MSTKIHKFLGEVYYPNILLHNPMYHGIVHAERVFSIGHYLCLKNHQVDIDVVTWFSFLHDICRNGDGVDSEHSDRAAAYAKMIRSRWLSALTDNQFSLLYEAIKYHNKIDKCFDITIDTCFDANRLDLPRRNNICVRKELLATEAAKSLFESYNGNYAAYIEATMAESTRLKFYDHCMEIRTMPEVGFRCNIVLNGKSCSPSCGSEWDIENAKSVAPYYDTPISGIFAFAYYQIEDLLNVVDANVRFYNSTGEPYDYMQIVLLQYDYNWIIGKQKNSFGGNGDELILSQANIIGTCPVSEHLKSDIDAIIKKYSTEQKLVKIIEV